MKKLIGGILLFIGFLALILLIIAELVLFKTKLLPTTTIGWIGNVALFIISIVVIFIGFKLKK